MLRFRVYKTALTGDLEKAFHQLEIKPCQRNFLRFLWIDNIFSDNPKILTFIFNRLVFGLVSAPFALNETLRKHFISNYQESDPEFVEEVLRQSYVDDFGGSKNSVTETFELFQKLKNRFKEGGFNIRKWTTNGEELGKTIENYERLNSPSTSDSKLESAQMPVEPGQ